MYFCLLAGWRDIADLLSALLIFVLVLIVAFYTTRFVGTVERKKQFGRNVTILETCRLGTGKYVQLVKVGERVIVVAVCRDRVTLLSEISADELDLKEDISLQKPSPFHSLLEKAKNKVGKGGGS